MSHVVILSASPTAPSRTDVLAACVAEQLEAAGHTTRTITLRDLSAEPLLRARASDPAIAEALEAVTSTEAVVVASPTFKASYSGLLKVFVDLLPMDTLIGTPVLPLLQGGSAAHVLALATGLKPLLATIGATHIAAARFALSSGIRPAAPTATRTTRPRAEVGRPRPSGCLGQRAAGTSRRPGMVGSRTFRGLSAPQPRQVPQNSADHRRGERLRWFRKCENRPRCRRPAARPDPAPQPSSLRALWPRPARPPRRARPRPGSRGRRRTTGPGRACAAARASSSRSRDRTRR